MKTETKYLRNSRNWKDKLNRLGQPQEQFKEKEMFKTAVPVPKTIFSKLIEKTRNKKKVNSPNIIYLEMIPPSKKQFLLRQINDLLFQLEQVKADLFKMKSY